MTRKKHWALLTGGVLAATGAAGVVLAWGGADPDTDDRREEVAERGREVMPFDLDLTTHRFTPTESGGTQDVTADEPGDTEQVSLIRAHLREEAEAFSRGDFGDPARIHGADMPGLAELSDGYQRIDVRYAERTDGATLTYATGDPALTDALHRWFQAQLSDHGTHAEHGNQH